MDLRVAKDTVVAFDFVLKGETGEVLDSSTGDVPMLYLHGHGNIVPGLESALEGKQSGDAIKVHVPADRAYGPREEVEPQVLSRKELPEDVEIGEQLLFEDEDGELFPMWVIKVSDEQVWVDENHPLAGMNLDFEVTIKDVRAATRAELDHGHPHGTDGHEEH